MPALRHPLFIAVFCILFVLPAHAMAASPVLTNGSDGTYWGLSQADVRAKAPGKFVQEKKMAGFLGLVYQGDVNGIPVETFYTVKGDKCWKITINTPAGEKKKILPLFDAVVKELTKTMGEPSEKDEFEDVSKSVSWKGGDTTASVYCSFRDGKAEVSIAYESKALAKAIWGKLAE